MRVISPKSLFSRWVQIQTWVSQIPDHSDHFLTHTLQRYHMADTIFKGKTLEVDYSRRWNGIQQNSWMKSPKSIQTLPSTLSTTNHLSKQMKERGWREKNFEIHPVFTYCFSCLMLEKAVNVAFPAPRGPYMFRKCPCKNGYFCKIIWDRGNASAMKKKQNGYFPQVLAGA